MNIRRFFCGCFVLCSSYGLRFIILKPKKSLQWIIFNHLSNSQTFFCVFRAMIGYLSVQFKVYWEICQQFYLNDVISATKSCSIDNTELRFMFDVWQHCCLVYFNLFFIPASYFLYIWLSENGALVITFNVICLKQRREHHTTQNTPTYAVHKIHKRANFEPNKHSQSVFFSFSKPHLNINRIEMAPENPDPTHTHTSIVCHQRVPKIQRQHMLHNPIGSSSSAREQPENASAKRVAFIARWMSAFRAQRPDDEPHIPTP